MTILCPYCASAGTNSWLRLSEYEAHKLKAHPEQIERLALLSMTTAQEQVEYIYEHHPETKQDNGLLLLRFAQGYPQLTLTEAEDLYILKAPYNSFFYFLKRANSITRLGRHLRQPKLNGETLSYSSPALKTGIKATEAVKKVLDEVPQARYNEGLLAERVSWG